MRKKIRGLQLNKRRSFRIFILAEVLLLSVGIFGLFGKNRVYEYGPEHMQINFGAWDEGTGSCHVEESAGQTGNMVDFVGISLPKGVYSVELQYDTDTLYQNSCTVSRGTAGYKGLLTNGAFCYPETASTDFAMWLLEDVSDIGIHAFYGGQGEFSVSGLSVRETNALSRIWIFFSLLGGV